MGIGDSKLEKELGDSIPETARLYGFDNLGNTCYLNAILQALSFTVPFRENLLKYYAALKQEQKLQGGAANDDDLAYALAELYTAVQSQRKRVGSFTPRAFVKLLRKSNELFGSFAQQDGHEFYNYLINTVLERIQQRDFRRAPGAYLWLGAEVFVGADRRD
ncbi:putative ubiquitin carboxyl-terminal hydrolase 3 [Paratrimastix pyriformis]|uniref:ubiquitinyl hydrolase 1 n=1 Tax=Paratrimastix pyriformis TaxID=342808 RepID=A0ABQ8UDX2_9EUKA|nr:putative ubiquitin carboxyl-terminal hydrolase 3 [Paratrimastix pyriformis]